MTVADFVAGVTGGGKRIWLNQSSSKAANCMSIIRGMSGSIAGASLRGMT